MLTALTAANLVGPAEEVAGGLRGSIVAFRVSTALAVRKVPK